MSKLGHYAEECAFLYTKYMAHNGRGTFEYTPSATPALAMNSVELWDSERILSNKDGQNNEYNGYFDLIPPPGIPTK